MTTQPIASSHPAPSAPGPARHRRIRTAAGIIGVAALLAGGGYLATATNGPDAASPTSAAGTEVNPSAQTLRELHQSVAGQYGNHSAHDAAVNPSVQMRRALHRQHRRPVRPCPLKEPPRQPTAEAAPARVSGEEPDPRGMHRPTLPRDTPVPPFLFAKGQPSVSTRPPETPARDEDQASARRTIGARTAPAIGHTAAAMPPLPLPL